MTSFPSVIPRNREGKIPLPTDIGLDHLLKRMYDQVPIPTVSNQVAAKEVISKALDRWVLSLETDPTVIAERQKIIQYTLSNPEFITTIDAIAIYPTPRSDYPTEFERYEAMMRRFDSFTEAVGSIAGTLERNEVPRTLAHLVESCQQERLKLEEARRHLNPEIELSVGVEGTFKFGTFVEKRNLVEEDPERGGQKLRTHYVLINKGNGCIMKAVSADALLGRESYHGDMFLSDLRYGIMNRFIEKAAPTQPFFTKVYTLEGILTYNPAEKVMAGEIRFLRRKDGHQQTFSVSQQIYHDTPGTIVKLATLAHNYQIINPFEESIRSFENTVVELKALAAVIKALKQIEQKGYPLTFPEIVTDGQSTDLSISEMYHPLLVTNGKAVVPNDVDVAHNQNVRIITGANNNGKTCYMDALGLSQAMYQAGFPIVAKEARMRVKDRILTHYVRPGDLHASQSRFAHECARVIELTKDVTGDSLVLCDELFTGTAPQDGEVVSQLVLDSLVRTGATLWFTTHYHGLGDTFRSSPYVAQLCAKLDHSANPAKYTYKIVPGVSRDSDGLLVASQFGVNQDYLTALLAQKEKEGKIKLR